ncbi:MAG TPA: hypothetical protein VJS65_12770, partial [Verrucomicrobiae bacterium]|nr:hypothetical protein [Verrucomicrobiae bacterium]
MNRPLYPFLLDSMKSMPHLPAYRRRATSLAAGLLACLAAVLALNPSAARAAAGDLLPVGQLNGTVALKQLGYTVASVGTNRFAVSLPYLNINTTNGMMTNAGVVHIFGLTTNWVTGMVNPDSRKDDLFGWTLKGVGTDMLAVGAPYK